MGLEWRHNLAMFLPQTQNIYMFGFSHEEKGQFYASSLAKMLRAMPQVQQEKQYETHENN